MRYATGVALVTAAGVLWSFQALIIRQIDEAGSWAITFWRAAAMLPVVLAFLAARSGGSPWPAIRKAGLAGVLGGIGLIAAMGGAILALQSTTVANAVFLFAATPFLAAVLGRVLLGEPVAGRTWIAIGVALIGILAMVRDGLAEGNGAWVGDVAALSSALGFAAFTVALRWRHLEDSLPASVLGAALTLGAAAAAARWTGQSLAAPPSEILLCLFMGAVTLSGGMILYTLGSKVVPSAELALLANIEVMLAPLWVWLVMGEGASGATLTGGAILLAAILFNAGAGLRARGAAAAP